MLMHESAAEWIHWLATVTFISSLLRIGLHWLRGLLEISIATTSSFWSIFDKVERSLAYISISLAAFGKKPNGNGATKPLVLK